METTIERATKIVKQGGFKLTKQRKSLLELLAENYQRYIDLTDLDGKMRELYPNMSYTTVYRNIREFANLGLVEEQQHDGKTEVKFQCDDLHQHHHHFICNRCGKVQELEMCPLNFFEEQLPGSTITGHQFELYGLCAECTKKAAN